MFSFCSNRRQSLCRVTQSFAERIARTWCGCCGLGGTSRFFGSSSDSRLTLGKLSSSCGFLPRQGCITVGQFSQAFGIGFAFRLAWRLCRKCISSELCQLFGYRFASFGTCLS